MNRNRILSLSVAAAVLAAAVPAGAQVAESNRAGISRTNLFSTNPIGIIFEWFNGEFEHAVSPTVSVAVAGSRFDFDNDDVTSLDGIVRYYPSARAIRGFSIGGSVGYTDVDQNFDCSQCGEDDFNAFSIGVRADYVWILGRDQHFAAAAGLGAKRLFGGNTDGVEALPIGRLSIGYAW